MRVHAVLIATLAICQTCYSQDTTCGILWDAPIQLSDSSNWTVSPKIALSGDDTVNVIWVSFSGSEHRVPYTRSVDGGQTWEAVRDLVVDTVQYPYPFGSNLLATQGQEVYVFAANEPFSQTSGPKPIVLVMSTSGGTTWEIPHRIGLDSVVGLNSANVLGDTMTVVYSPHQDGFSRLPRLIFSTNRGQTWTRTPDTLDGYARTALTSGVLHLVRNVFTNNAQETLYLRSFDVGQTFSDPEILSTVDGRFSLEQAIAAHISGMDTTVFATWRDGIACAGLIGCTIIGRQSRTGGGSWGEQQVLTDAPRGSEPSVAIGPQGFLAVTWTDEITFNGSNQVVIRYRCHPNSSWSPVTALSSASSGDGLSQVTVSRQAIHVVWSTLVGGTFRIFYRRGRFSTVNVREQSDAPFLQTRLEQNYPNPFNPTTVISFELPHASHIVLKVFDVLGKLVATLADEWKEAGQHRVMWTPDDLPSGVYLYRLNDGRLIATRKALLVR